MRESRDGRDVGSAENFKLESKNERLGSYRSKDSNIYNSDIEKYLNEEEIKMENENLD